ncbi:MAG: hypothetical protein AAGJ70_11740, partial [Pseudomonadota bacterium]
ESSEADDAGVSAIEPAPEPEVATPEAPTKSPAEVALANAVDRDPFFNDANAQQGETQEAEEYYRQAALFGGTTFAPLVEVLDSKNVVAARGAAPTFVAEAKQMLAEGKVVEARRVLSLISFADVAEVSLALARTYDPNIHQNLDAPDAEASVELAEKWYRRWHRRSVQSGQVSGGINIERLIWSMRAFD